MPLMGFIDAHDDRMLATTRAIQRTLVRDGLVSRWDGDANGFVLTTAWLAECLALAGQHQDVVELSTGSSLVGANPPASCRSDEPAGRELGGQPSRRGSYPSG